MGDFLKKIWAKHGGDIAMLKWLILSFVVMIADQLSKQAIQESMSLYQRLIIMPHVNFTYVHNTGAAFSFLSDAGGWQRWLFAGLAIVISSILIGWLACSQKHQTLLAVSLSLILGGAIGNLIDRVHYGYVIDFIDVYYGMWHWPAFNIADSAICVGVGLLLLDSVLTKEEKNNA